MTLRNNSMKEKDETYGTDQVEQYADEYLNIKY